MTKIAPPPLVQAATPAVAARPMATASAVASPAAIPAMAKASGAAQARLSASPDPAKIAKSAQDFEAMAVGQLLQPMFDTVDTAHGTFGGGDGEEAWKPMMVQEIAKHIAANGGLGLAKPVYDAMLRLQEEKSK